MRPVYAKTTRALRVSFHFFSGFAGVALSADFAFDAAFFDEPASGPLIRSMKESLLAACLPYLKVSHTFEIVPHLLSLSLANIPAQHPNLSQIWRETLPTSLPRPLRRSTASDSTGSIAAYFGCPLCFCIRGQAMWCAAGKCCHR
jgi:hypothetical protein